MTSQLRAVQLLDQFYVLLRKITAGTKSVVWQAAQLDARPDPALARLVDLNGPDLIDYLRTAPAPETTTEAFSDPTVALKVAKEKHEDDLLEEAASLKKLLGERWHQPRRAQVVRLLEQRLPTPDIPVAVLEWVEGVQIDALPEPFEERKGLFVAHQLAEVLSYLYNIYQFVLTDTLKPNSLFWSEGDQSLFLIDWNVLGRPEEFGAHTLPIFGNTLHRMLVGKTVRWSPPKSYNLDPVSVGGEEAWSELTYGAMALIRQTLLADFDDTDPGELARQLSQAVEEQWGLWDLGWERLRAQAASGEGESAIRHYDLARIKQEGGLDAEDEGRMLAELKTILVGYAERGRHAAALITLSWARQRYPYDPGKPLQTQWARWARWAWLVHSAAYADGSGPSDSSRILVQALRDMAAEKFSRAIDALGQAAASQYRSALLAEARFWSIYHRPPSSDHLQALEEIYPTLIDVWEGHFDGEMAISDVRDAFEEYGDRVSEIEELFEMSLQKIRQENLQLARDLLNALQEKDPPLPDLRLWIAALDELLRDGAAKVLALFYGSPGLTDPEARHADEIRQIAIGRLKNEARDAAQFNCFERSIRLLEYIAKHLPDDEIAERRLQRCREVADRYQALQDTYRAAQVIEEQVNALNQWIATGFVYDTNGLKRERPLLEILWERMVSWASGLAEELEYADAIAVMQDRTKPDLGRVKNSLDEARLGEYFQLNPTIRHKLTERVDELQREADALVQTWKSRRRERARSYLDRAQQLFAAYAGESSSRHEGYSDHTAGSMIDDLMSRAGSLIRQSLAVDVGYEDALVAQTALEAFRRGRLALKRLDLKEASDHLDMASNYAWRALQGLVAPYAERAKAVRAMISVDSLGRDRDEMLDHIRSYAGARERIARLPEVDVSRFDAWLNTLPAQVKSDLVDRRLKGEIDALGERLSRWRKRWSSLVIGDDALLYESEYHDWRDVLEKGSELTGLEKGERQRFEDWHRELLQHCNYDLARAMLLQAQASLSQGRGDLAAEREAKALSLARQAFHSAPAPSTIDGGFTGEIRRMWRAIWREHMDQEDIPSGLTAVYDALDGREALDQLAELFLPAPDGERIFVEISQLLAPEGTVEGFIEVVGDYQPSPTHTLLWSHQTAAELVEAERYAEAKSVASRADELHSEEDFLPLVRALTDDLRMIWEAHLDANRWPETLEEAYDKIEHDDARASLFDHYLADSLDNLAEECDQALRGEQEVQSLCSVLAGCRPQACRPVLYALDRAAVMVKEEAFNLAHRFVEVATQDGELEQDERRLRQAVAEEVGSFSEHTCDQMMECEPDVATAAEILHQGLKKQTMDPDLFELARQFGLSQPSTDVGSIARRMRDAIWRKNADTFAIEMARVPVSEWDRALRHALREALAGWYSEEVNQAHGYGLMAVYHILRNADSIRERVKRAGTYARRFNELSLGR